MKPKKAPPLDHIHGVDQATCHSSTLGIPTPQVSRQPGQPNAQSDVMTSVAATQFGEPQPENPPSLASSPESSPESSPPAVRALISDSSHRVRENTESQVTLSSTTPSHPSKPARRKGQSRVICWCKKHVKRLRNIIWKREKVQVPRKKQRRRKFRNVLIGLCLLVRGREVHKWVKATFDTGMRRNLMSPSLYKTYYGSSIHSTEETAVIEGLGGGILYSNGTVQGRWSLKEPEQVDGIYADDKFMDAEFMVCRDDQRFDVIIGLDTIEEYELFTWREEPGLMGRVLEPIDVSMDQAKRKEREQRERKLKNDARKRAIDQKAASTSTAPASLGQPQSNP